jgi:hypothetical protein
MHGIKSCIGVIRLVQWPSSYRKSIHGIMAALMLVFGQRKTLLTYLLNHDTEKLVTFPRDNNPNVAKDLVSFPWYINDPSVTDFPSPDILILVLQKNWFSSPEIYRLSLKLQKNWFPSPETEILTLILQMNLSSHPLRYWPYSCYCYSRNGSLPLRYYP